MLTVPFYATSGARHMSRQGPPRGREPLQFLDPVFDNDDLRRRLIGVLLDHEEPLAVDSHVIGSLVTEASGHVRPVEDSRWNLRAPLAVARVDTHGHEGAIRRHIEDFVAAWRPERPRTAGRRDQPLSRARVRKRRDIDLKLP